MVFASSRSAGRGSRSGGRGSRSAGRGFSDSDHHLWLAYRVAGIWYAPRPISQLNTAGREGSPWVDVHTDLWFAATRGDTKNRDLFRARRDRRDWGAPTPVAELNTAGDEFDPCLDPAGNLLLFAVQKTGAANSDLVVSYKNASVWSQPKPLVQGVNTMSDEASPVVSRDGRTLYFNRGGRIYFVPLSQALPER